MYIKSAKVPIVKFTMKDYNLEGDISLYNCLALKNSTMLKDISEIDDRVRILGYCIKVFAKVNYLFFLIANAGKIVFETKNLAYKTIGMRSYNEFELCNAMVFGPVLPTCGSYVTSSGCPSVRNASSYTSLWYFPMISSWYWWFQLSKISVLFWTCLQIVFDSQFI